MELLFDPQTKLFLAIAATGISVCNLVYYISTVIRGRTRPHAYTWLIWSIISLIIAVAQFQNGGGYGAYVMAWIATACMTNAALGFVKGRHDIAKSDKVCLGLCLAAIAVWVATKNPFWSILLVTAVDGAGFYPTIRKSWNDPLNENWISFFIYGITFSLSIMALETYSFYTVFYPAVIAFLSWMLVAILHTRRYQLRYAGK